MKDRKKIVLDIGVLLQNTDESLFLLKLFSIFNDLSSLLSFSQKSKEPSEMEIIFIFKSNCSMIIEIRKVFLDMKKRESRGKAFGFDRSKLSEQGKTTFDFLSDESSDENKDLFSLMSKIRDNTFHFLINKNLIIEHLKTMCNNRTEFSIIINKIPEGTYFKIANEVLLLPLFTEGIGDFEEFVNKVIRINNESLSLINEILFLSPLLEKAAIQTSFLDRN